MNKYHAATPYTLFSQTPVTYRLTDPPYIQTPSIHILPLSDRPSITPRRNGETTFRMVTDLELLVETVRKSTAWYLADTNKQPYGCRITKDRLLFPCNKTLVFPIYFRTTRKTGMPPGSNADILIVKL